MLGITKVKDKVIISILAGALGALILLTAIGVAAKIVVIVSAAIFSAAIATYLLLSFPLIQKILAWAKVKAKEDVVVPTAEQKEAEAQRLINEREQERLMNTNFPDGPIDVFGNPINTPDLDAIISAENSKFPCINLPPVPDRIVLSVDQNSEQSTSQKYPRNTQYTKDCMSVMKSLHEKMENLYPVRDSYRSPDMIFADTSNVRINKGPLLSPEELKFQRDTGKEVSTPNTYVDIDSSKSTDKKSSPEELLSWFKETYKQKCENYIPKQV